MRCTPADVGHQRDQRHHPRRACSRSAIATFLGLVLAFIAILVASINVFGGFTVTARMLEMFKREDTVR